MLFWLAQYYSPFGLDSRYPTASLPSTQATSGHRRRLGFLGVRIYCVSWPYLWTCVAREETGVLEPEVDLPTKVTGTFVGKPNSMTSCFGIVGCKKATRLGLQVLPERIWSEMRSKNHAETQNHQNR